VRSVTRQGPSGPVVAQAGGDALLWSPAGNGDAKTWPEVMAFVDASPTPLTIWLEPFVSYSIPSGRYDLKRSCFQAERGLAPAAATVTLPEGSVLHECSGIGGAVVLSGQQSATPSLTFDYAAGGGVRLFFIEELAVLSNDGAAPMIDVVGGETIALLVERLGGLGGSTPVVRATNTIVGMLVTHGALSIPDGWATGAGSVIGYLHDGSIFFPSTPGFSLVNIPFGQDGGYGPTPFRPVGLFAPPKMGCAYFDTDVGGMVWWDGGSWV